MLDSLLLTEIMIEQKRRNLEDRISRDQLVRIAAEGGAIVNGPRATVAAAIVRFGIMLDGTAGRSAAAVVQH